MIAEITHNAHDTAGDHFGQDPLPAARRTDTGGRHK